MMKSKRLLAMLMTGILTAGMFSATAFAEEGNEAATSDPEYAVTNPYVINLGGTQNLGDYDAWESSLYVSPYIGKMTYPRVDLPEDNYYARPLTYGTVQELYNLINTNVLNTIPDGQREGEGAYASIPAYCTDASVGAHAGYEYQRVNLEDSSYYPEGVAGHIRAIMWKSFPHITDMNVIEDAVNTWLDESGISHTDVDDLTTEEALQATQLAIWDLAGGDDVTVRDVFNDWFGDGKCNWGWTYGDGGEYDIEGWIYYTSEDALVNPFETLGENTENNIEMLFDYLMALDPMEPQTVVVSEISFTEKELTVINNGDDTYDVKVSATVDVNINEGDELVLTASLGDAIKSVQLADGINEFAYTFEDVKSLADVKLEINGYQTGEDAYFFTGEERVTTQSMVAFDNSKLPVHAETTVGLDRVINFKKTTVEDGVKYPLEGIQFEIYYLCTVDEYTAECAKDDNKYATFTKDLVAGQTPVATVTTDIAGKASYNLTENEQPDGIYLIIEKDHPAIEKTLDPFPVAVPMTSADGSGLTYTINLEPKNDVINAPEVKKDVTEIDNETDSFDVNEEHTWIIRGDVPADMADAKEYVITDELDYRLTYAGKLSVKVEKETEKANSASDSEVLVEGTDYKLTVTKNTIVSGSDNEEIYKFEVKLTAVGMDKVAKIAGENYDDYEVRVYFNAKIDEDASVGEAILNQATLNYTNSVNFKYETESDEPYVYTCGINIYKHDAKDSIEALEGAKFKLAKVVDKDTEGATPLVTKDSETVYVVYEEFYATANLTGDKVSVVTTDEDGAAVIYGLEEGEYYLVEIQAPKGYNLLSYPVSVVLNQSSHLEKNVVEVANSNTFKLPETGGIGTTIFTVGGVLLIAAAVVILIMKKKNENELEAKN